MKEAFEKIRRVFYERQIASELKVRELDDLPFNLRKCYDETDLEDARAQSFKEAEEIVSEVEAEYGNGWIPVEKALPEDCDNRFYMCIVENHEEDLPMYCQYNEDYGFGFWHDYYDEHTLGFVDSEFETNEELGYEKVIAWQPLPGAYKPEEGE